MSLLDTVPKYKSNTKNILDDVPEYESKQKNILDDVPEYGKKQPSLFDRASRFAKEAVEPLIPKKDETIEWESSHYDPITKEKTIGPKEKFIIKADDYLKPTKELFLKPFGKFYKEKVKAPIGKFTGRALQPGMPTPFGLPRETIAGNISALTGGAIDPIDPRTGLPIGISEAGHPFGYQPETMGVKSVGVGKGEPDYTPLFKETTYKKDIKRSAGEILGGVEQFAIMPGKSLVGKLAASRGISELASGEPSPEQFAKGVVTQDILTALAFGAAKIASQALGNNLGTQKATAQVLRHLEQKANIEISPELARNVFGLVQRSAQGLAAGGTAKALGKSNEEALATGIFAAMNKPGELARIEKTPLSRQIPKTATPASPAAHPEASTTALVGKSPYGKPQIPLQTAPNPPIQPKPVVQAPPVKPTVEIPEVKPVEKIKVISPRKTPKFDTEKAAAEGNLKSLVKSYGGIRKPDYLPGEWKKYNKKLFGLIRKNGAPLDDMAATIRNNHPEFGDMTDSELLTALSEPSKAKPLKTIQKEYDTIARGENYAALKEALAIHKTEGGIFDTPEEHKRALKEVDDFEKEQGIVKEKGQKYNDELEDQGFPFGENIKPAEPILKPAAGPEYEAEQLGIAEKAQRQKDLESYNQQIESKKQFAPIPSDKAPLFAEKGMDIQEGLFKVKAPGSSILKESEPLMAEARKHKSAGGFLESKLKVYHGTDYKFSGDEFSSQELGKNTNARSAKMGHFFTSSKEMANFYARQPQNYYTEMNKKISKRAEKIQKTLKADKDTAWDKAVKEIVGEGDYKEIEKNIEQTKKSFRETISPYRELGNFRDSNLTRIAHLKKIGEDKYYEIFKNNFIDYTQSGDEYVVSFPDREVKRFKDYLDAEKYVDLPENKEIIKSYLKEDEAWKTNEIIKKMPPPIKKEVERRITLITDYNESYRKVKRYYEKYFYSKQAYAGGDSKTGEVWPERREEVAPDIKERFLTIKNPKVHWMKESYRDVTFADLIEKAKQEGKDGVIIKNTTDPYRGDVYVVLDNSQIKTKDQMVDIWNKANKGEIKKPSGTVPVLKKIEKIKVQAPGEEPLAPGVQELSAKNWQVEMAKEPKDRQTINKVQILRELSRVWGIHIRGKATQKMQAGTVGTYSNQTELIRMKKWGELEPITHEITHHIDKKYADILWKPTKRGRSRPFEKKMISEIAGLDYSTTQRRTSEGFPEFIRLLMTNPAEAKAKAPLFYEYFNNELLAKNPGLKSKLDITRNMMKIWQDQGSENRILAQIDFRGELEKTPGIANLGKKLWAAWHKKWIDEFYPIRVATEQVEKITGKQLRPSKNPFALATLFKSKSGAIARTVVKEKAIDEFGNVIGPGLAEIIKPIDKKQMKSFIAYLTALRARDLSKRDIESGFDIADVNYIIKKYDNPTWKKTAEEITKWSDHLLTWVTKAGGLDESLANKMRELNPLYVPFKRVFTEELEVSKGLGGKAAAGKAVKAIKGSGRPIINPLEAMITQAQELILKSHRMRIASAIADMANNEGVGGIVTEVPPPTESIRLSIEKIKNFIKQQKALKSTGEMTSSNGHAELDKLLSDDGFLTMFSQGQTYKGKDNIIPIWKNGEVRFYELNKELYDALAGVDPLKMGPLLKLLSPAKRLLQLGATGLRAAFTLVRNPFRDISTRAVLTKTKGGLPAVLGGSLRGMVTDLTTKPGDLAWRFKAVGGDLSGMMGLDRQEAMNLYDEMMTEKLGWMGKTLLIGKNPFNFLRDVFSVSELGPRIDEFEKMYKYYKENRPDWSDNDCFIAATNDAQDVTTNFTRSGEWGKQVGMGAAFFNASIQGPEKLFRSARENPKQFVARGLAYITLTGLYFWYKNKDKQWYKNLPLEYKYSNIFIDTSDLVLGKGIKDGPIVRLPMPFDLGTIFYSVPLALVDSDYLEGGERAKAVANIFEGQVPDPFPSLFSPMYDIARNKNYLDKPIESRGLQSLPSELRKKDWNRKMSGHLSMGFNSMGIELSPVQIDYLIDNYTGGALRQIPGKMPEKLTDVPIISDVTVRSPLYPSRQINSFYEKYVNSQKASSTLKQIEKEGRTKEAKDYYKKHFSEIEILSDYNKTADELSEMRGFLNRIKLEKISSGEKRFKTEKIFKRMTAMLEKTLEYEKSIRKEKKQ